MKKSTAFAYSIILFAISPAAWADAFCDAMVLLIDKSKLDVAAIPSPPISSNPPNTGHLWTQIRTTQPLETTVTAESGETQSHECSIASDLVEVDTMMADVGLAGHVTGEWPLFNNVYLEYVAQSEDQKVLQDLVAEVWDPNGAPNAVLDQLKANDELYTPEVLNIYYVHFDDDYVFNMEDEYISNITGVHIRNDDGRSDRMIFVSDASHADTLAHEFGHAMSAAHVNFWDFDGKEWCAKYLPDPDTTVAEDAMEDMACEFSRRNYMWAKSSMDRQQLGDPQKLRMIYNDKSLITEFSNPGDANKLDCPDFSNNFEKGCARLKGYAP